MCVSKQGGLGFEKLQLFNLDFLAKQGWNILQKNNSLLHKIFKAKYFPNDDFFKAKLGANPSYPWRSIWEASKWLYKGCKWRIGNGTRV